MTVCQEHDLRVVAEQHPWLGWWRVHIRCRNCDEVGWTPPGGPYWRRRTVERVVNRLAHYLDFHASGH